MAEAVIGSIAETIVAILGSPAIETVGKLRGVKHELKALRDTVSMLRPVLDHAEEQYHQIPHIRVWVEELKDAFYEAQDVLEEFNIEAMRRELRGHNEMMKEVRTFFSSSNELAFKLKMSDKVRAVRKRIEAIKAEKKFHLDERPVDSRAERERRKSEETHSFIREGDIIGRDDDRKKVMEFLLDSDVKEDVSILPIVGIGGLGKTALAQCVYNDKMVDEHFYFKVWVCVSNDFNVKKIVRKIITCATKKEPTDVGMELLQRKLRATIDGKRYLLVLDDVWNIEQETWLSLKTLLMGGTSGSKILVTTRIPLVAEITNTAPPHVLKGLSESASLNLLMQMAGPKIEEVQDSDMLAIGKEIVRKCSWVPLVVRTVGSLLILKKTKSEWLHFKDYELPEVAQREDRIISVLKLSYDHLPSHLKLCFALCSLFPKDYEIEKQTLVDLWMAEGFIQQSNGSQHLEDIAHKYFMDLLWSNFFQDYQEDAKTCKMHDLMHDLACLVAGTECWVTGDHTKPIPKRTRHLSHDLPSNLMGELPISSLKASPLRSILFTYSKTGQSGPTSKADLRQLIQSFRRLRILDLHAKNVKKVPRSICKLKHLTYLDLSYNGELKRLPNSITRLQNLQTLNLNCCSALEELPKGIRKLVSLRNLDIAGCGKLSYVPRGLGQLSSLHRLTRFILPQKKALAKNYCRLGELKGLNDIRGSLCIENLGSVVDAVAESRAANLKEKHGLEILELKWGDFDIDDAEIGNRDEAVLDGLRPHSNLQKLTIDGYKGESFPRWMTNSLVSCLPHLVELCLLNCKRWKRLPQFGLNNLKKLEISYMELLECLPEECLKSLSSLEHFDIKKCPRLTSLSLGIRHLSNLVSLWIEDCEELDLSKDESGNILDFQGLRSLRSVVIWTVPKVASLPQWLLQASNLVRLEIWNCDELDLSKDESGNILDFQGFHSLRSVIIWELPKLASLPQWLIQASNLENLHISSCYNLKAVPEQIEALRSLQQLDIHKCPSLTSLPEGMRRLASLTHLTIEGCPELEERCRRDAGEDWYKIAHIPNISNQRNCSISF